MARGSYKHWRNSDKAGDTCFVTTTCVDFAKLFERAELRSEVLRCLCSDCLHYGAILHAFAIMPHHVHLLASAPSQQTISWFIQRFKTNSAKIVKPRLNEFELSQLEQQKGLSERQIWKRSFRSFSIANEIDFFQKIDYIHNNPLKDGLVEKQSDYFWSSSRYFEEGNYNPETGLAPVVWGTLHTSSVEGLRDCSKLPDSIG